MRTWINAFCACLLLLSGLCQATETYVTYYHNDHLGSPAAATDDQGKLLWRAHYRPYGEREPHRDSAAFGTLGYTGHAQNERNGLVYAGARYYDPLVGRFLSVDPVGPQETVPGSFNRYAYGLNNPYRYVDPDGRWAEDTVIGVASVSIGAYSLGRNVSNSNWGAAAVDLGGLLLDGVAMALPVVPAAAGLAIQASRASSQTAKVASKTPPSIPDFIVSPGGTTFPVPKDAIGPIPVTNPAGTQTGVAFIGGAGGTNGQVTTMRIMNPTPARGSSPGYPNGYIKYENSASPKPQGVDPYTGKTLPNTKSHYPIY